MENKGYVIVYFDADNVLTIHKTSELLIDGKSVASGDVALDRLVGASNATVNYKSKTLDSAGIERVKLLPYKCSVLFSASGNFIVLFSIVSFFF